ncbi:hypothetical protein NKR19_g9568 [Coniochaeta hoffmannii]|uniref:C2H2-type domain-containing protein n=1 Tax=Coniochaeta hoffmannii TaxID=91930 RepID=A0AA38R2K8_9PEZI|nr:hypothetical protein NKR19_g9568 [Coniochaeta hoffmannii]
MNEQQVHPAQTASNLEEITAPSSTASEAISNEVSSVTKDQTAGIIEHKFPCPHCDQAFTRMDSVERHEESVHSKEKPFLCPVQNCKQATVGFSRKDALVRHMRRVHGVEDDAEGASQDSQVTASHTIPRSDHVQQSANDGLQDDQVMSNLPADGSEHVGQSGELSEVL